jgi:hypothetical protein
MCDMCWERCAAVMPVKVVKINTRRTIVEVKIRRPKWQQYLNY